MLQTTIYNEANACITGAYHSAKGDKIEVEYMGTAMECECYINGIRQENEGSNEVQSVVIRKSIKCATPGYTGFALHGIWHNATA